MKCPKCGYLGFETGDRCRNCGYDFSLLAGFDLPNLPFRDEASETGALPDLTYEPTPDAAHPDAPAAVPPAAPRAQAPRAPHDDSRPPTPPVLPPETPRSVPSPPLPVDAGPGARGPAVDPEQVAALRRAADERTARIAANAAARLPLFAGGQDADAPLVTPPVRPRAPLSVRRATPEIPRFRAEPRAVPAPDVERIAPPLAPAPAPTAAAPPAVRPPASRTFRAVPAPAARRLAAGLVDLGVLAGLDLLVLYFTLEICGLTAQQLGLLPRVPLVGFLALLDGSYLVAFTAGSQTIGKMAAGLRVVADDGGPITIGRAVVRTAVWVLSAVPLGLGFLSIVASRDRTALHDRFARTRVVTVSSDG